MLEKRLFIPVILTGVIMLLSEALAHEWMAPPEAAELKNPVAKNEATVTRGKELYQQNCSFCHGDKLEGLPSDITGLSQNTPDLKSRLQNHTEGDFFWKIQEGRGDMPSFENVLTDEETWQVINFINKMNR